MAQPGKKVYMVKCVDVAFVAPLSHDLGIYNDSSVADKIKSVCKK